MDPGKIWAKFKAEAKASGLWEHMTPPMQRAAWEVFDSLRNAVGPVDRALMTSLMNTEQREGVGLFLQWLRHSGHGRRETQ